MDLKSQIIQFMRDRPFLWNIRHPGYKDTKKREAEFEAFSKEINHSVNEIKRVWHVLRTNFFRAHKILLERKEFEQKALNGAPTKMAASVDGSTSSGSEKHWKYYKAMEYVLEGTNCNRYRGCVSLHFNNSTTTGHHNDTTNSKSAPSRRNSCSGNLATLVICPQVGEENSVAGSGGGAIGAETPEINSMKNIRQTRSSKVFRDSQGAKVEVKPSNQSIYNCTTIANLPVGPSTATTTTIAIVPIKSVQNNITQPSDMTVARTRAVSSRVRSSTLLNNSNNNNNNNTDTGNANNTMSMSELSSTSLRPSLGNSNEPSMSLYASLDTLDEDQLYARYLSTALKKFDSTTKEVIKLKFQEIIVDYMQSQQQQQSSRANKRSPSPSSAPMDGDNKKHSNKDDDNDEAISSKAIENQQPINSTPVV